MIAPVAIAGILIVAILANQTFAYYSSSSSAKCKTTQYGGLYCKSNHRHGNFGTSNAGNIAQGSSNTGNGATSQQSSNTGNGPTNTFVLNPPTSSQQSSNTGNGQSPIFTPNSPTSSGEGSNTGNGATSQQSSNTGKGQSPVFTFNSPSLPEQSSNTGNAAQEASSNNGNAADLSKTILEIHNSERAAVGVQPLVWSDKLATDAKPWAEHLATTSEFKHDPNLPQGEGESIAGFNPSKGVSAPGEGQQLWVAEKKDYHGQPIPPMGSPEWNTYPGHYTQMVWRGTKEVGCATASGGGHPYSILVCRYSPPGNYNGQKPY
jgi:uncharacterized protein YkwD